MAVARYATLYLCLSSQDLTAKALAGVQVGTLPHLGSCRWGLGQEQSHGVVIGSEELEKPRAVIRSAGLGSKHHKERKITEGRMGGVVL